MVQGSEGKRVNIVDNQKGETRGIAPGNGKVGGENRSGSGQVKNKRRKLGAIVPGNSD